MKQITCGDLGGDCPFVAKGKTDDEVVKNMMAHAKKVHGAVLASMPKEVIDQRMAMMDEKLKKQK